MRLAAAFVAHELRTQGRSLRFRATAGLYLLAGVLPAVLIHLQRTRLSYFVGSASYASEVANVVPLLTAAFAFLLAMDGITREQGEGAWTTVTLCEVSNAGYLLRRWLAIQVLLLPLSVLPFLAAAGVALADGAVPVDPWVFAGPWLLHVAPLSMAMSALGIAVGTIGGGPLNALPLLALLGLATPLLNQALYFFGIRFGAPLSWAGFGQATWTAGQAAGAFRERNFWGWGYPLPASESGYDLRILAEQSLPNGALLAAMVVLALGVATRYLRRTRPDVRPRWVRPGHPFRGFLKTWGRLRERYTPDPAPAPADRIVLALSLLAAVALFAVLIVRAGRYEELAGARYGEQTMPSPSITAPTVVPGLWRVEGRIGPGSGIAIQVTGELVNQGSQPEGHLSFQINPHLKAEVTADSGRIALARGWGRLDLDLEPPIAPGGRRTLRFRLAGEPASVVFPLQPGSSFDRSYARHSDALFSRDQLVFASSYREPVISGYRLRLLGGDLLPVPRYGAWHDREVISPPARMELSLSAPPGIFLADTCGGIGQASETGTRLASRCRMPLANFGVVGGRQKILAGKTSAMTVAVFPAHEKTAELHLGFLARSPGLLEEAWPGIGRLGSLTVIEWPDRENASMWRYREPGAATLTVNGNLVFLDELDLLRLESLQPERLVSEILSARLAGRRRIAPEHSRFFHHFFRAMAMARLGLGPRNGAVIGPLAFEDDEAVRVSAFGQEIWSVYWHYRFPALISALETRMGAEPLKAAVEEFLARGEDPARGPGSATELFELLVRHSPHPVDRLIQDYIVAGHLPEPTLEGVRFLRAGDGWRVTGKMANKGTGEAICKVVLNTELGPESTIVRADTGETAPFEISTRHRPQGVILDPDAQCHRLVRKAGTPDRVYFEGGGL